MRKTT